MNRGEKTNRLFLEGTSPRASDTRGLVGESFPVQGSSQHSLGNIAHVGKRELQLSQFGIEPALAGAVAG